MHTLLQISDPHFGTDLAPVVAALEALARQQAPDIVLLSGDITQRARRTQFAAARAFVDRLAPAHLLSIPGNHDIALFNVFARAFYPYAHYSQYFGSDLEPSFQSEAILIQCVNTTRPHRHKDGEISVEQIERVAQRLQQATEDQVRVVVTHQPVHVVTREDKSNLLHGFETAVRAWSQAGADLVVGGHIHLPHVRNLQTAIADLPRRLWSVQAGTAVSYRVRGGIPNSVNIFRIAKHTCAVERWDYESTASAFSIVETHALSIDR
jgi:3',5'-cyclic AMP phosphodiesterase CpdA